MENEKQYITKKEFYSMTMHLCVIILFTGLISNNDIGKAYVGIWALGLDIYLFYKLQKARKEQIDK